MTNDQIRQIQAAVAYQRAGRLDEAAKIYRCVLDAAPDNFDSAYLLATLYAQQGNMKAAIDMFRRAARIRPEIVDAHYNLAVALGMAGNHAEAAKTYEKVLEINSRHPHARNNYAASLLNSGQVIQALAQYDELIAQHPHLADAYNNRGMALQYLKRLDEALRNYDEAIALRPDFAEAYVNRGNVQAALHHSDDALASYNKAIALKPDFADAYSNAGNIYCNRHSFDAALNAYSRALSLRPDDSDARSMRLYVKMHLCDWSDFDAECSALTSCIDSDSPIYPFSALAVSTSPEKQLKSARIFTKTRYPASNKPLWSGVPYEHDKIRIAYVSSDFREHAVSFLTAGMFECHDKSQFEVTAISIGPHDTSEMRRRLLRSFDEFIDVNALRDDEIASRVRNAEIDILIDLGGFTQGARMGIFANRPAPIQIGYLGYPGTTGAHYIDYIVADRFVIPHKQQQYYSEKIVYLPDAFQANDSGRQGSERFVSRGEAGLPEDTFVFCSFNNSYKITPTVFDIWMRLLRNIEGSVLWLLEGSDEVKHNLQKEAENRGVSPARLLFAPRIQYADYLARYRLADVFLDTVPFNAGATASDALWAGLPLVTCSGQAFCSRMAGSLLRATGLPELITESLADYEALAAKLARNPDLITSVKTTLKRNRSISPLFNTPLFTRHIEVAYMTMYRRYQTGLAPDHIDVPRSR